MNILRAIFFIIILIVIFLTNSFSQQWLNTSGEKMLAAVTDNQGNVYVTGYKTNSNSDIITIKYNASGSLIWSVLYNGPGNGDDMACAIAINKQGTYVYIAGYSTAQGNNKDFTIIRLNASNGSGQITYRYNTPNNSDDRAFGITVDRLNYVYATGYITQASLGKDIYTIKLNSSLTYIWGQAYNGNGNSEDKAFGVVVDSIGLNIYITGYSTDNQNGNDMITMSYDSSGTFRWLKTYNGNGNGEDRAFGIVIDSYSGGGLYVTGYSTNQNSVEDYTTIKYNPANGNTLWTSIYNVAGNQNDRAFGIVIDKAGNSYVTGCSIGELTSNDYVTIKYNSAGESVWIARYNNGEASGNDSATSLALSKNSDYVFVTGTSAKNNSGDYDIATIKYRVSDGGLTQLSRVSVPGSVKNVATRIVLDTNNDIFVTGYTQLSESNSSGLTMEYPQGNLVIGITQISSEVPLGYALYQNYPNPFNPVTKIRFDIPSLVRRGAGVVVLKIYDLLGREVSTLVNENLSPGTYEADWNSSNFAGGVYFYKLITNDFSETKKMILVK